MPTYIMLTTLTPEGVQTIKNNPGRIREVNREVEQLGATVKAQWATLGQFDFVNVIEAPDEKTIARVSMELGSRGSGRYETLSAIPIDDFIGLICRDAVPRRRAPAAQVSPNVLVLGGGAREHAIVQTLHARPARRRSPALRATSASPREASIRAIDPTDVGSVVGAARDIKADLVVVGPEAPLVAGIVDALTDAGIPCFGPPGPPPGWRAPRRSARR